MHNPKNILITGGCGFIGSNLIKYLLKEHQDINIINIDNLSYASNISYLKDIENKNNYKFEKLDIFYDHEKLLNIFNSFSIDTVIHLAAETHVDNSIKNPLKFLETNVLGTGYLLDAARNFWKNRKNVKFHHVSTDEVYGSTYIEGDKFTEKSHIKPSSPYSASKASSDHLVRAYGTTYGLPFNITNCSNNYGPNQHKEKLIPLVINNILSNKPIPIYGNGENIRDWLYVEDHCRAIDLVIRSDKIGETYNIGGNCEINNISIVKTICWYLDELLPNKNSYSSLITYVEDRPGHDFRYAIDASKIKNDIGWCPNMTFQQGILKTILWYINNR